MDLDTIYNLIINNLPDVAGYILSGLGALVVLGRAYVAITPNQEDDAFLKKLEVLPAVGWLFKLLVKFSPVQRK